MNTNTLINLLEKEINSFIENIYNLDSEIRRKNFEVDVSIKESKKIQQKVDEDLQRFSEVLEEVKTKVSILASNLKLIKNLDWDTLNVAFFGETNAGKSTLIEALIGGDGRTIGDGRKDFTKTINNYSLGKKIRIMDMPGIEGDETKVKKEIWKAVEKAHLIFYVYPDTKEPERGTLTKIKKYLRKNAEVYTVLNLRGIFPPKVLEKKEQIAQVIRERTDKHLKESLREIYKGSFLVHALFAFFARAKNIPENLWFQYKTALKFYNSKDKLMDISRIEELLNFLEEVSREQKLRILWGNYRKILVTQEEIISKLLNWKANFDKNIKEIREEIEKLKRKFERERKIFERNLQRIIETETDILRGDLRKLAKEAIDFEWSESTMKWEMNKRIKDFRNNLQKRLEREINSFNERIVKEMEILKKKLEFIAEFKASIDTSSIFEKLEYSFEEFLREIGDVVASIVRTIIAFLINPILGIIVDVISIVQKIWEWLFGNKEKKKSEAKREANKKVEETVKEIKRNIQNKLQHTYKEINVQFNNLLKQVNRYNKSLKKLSYILDLVVKKLIESNATVSLIFVKHLDPDAEFAYIQNNLKEGSSIAVVTPNKYELKSKLAKLSFKNVYIYSSKQELKMSIEHKQGEFFKRLKRLVELHE